MKKIKMLLMLLSVCFILFPQVASALGGEVAVGVWGQDPQGTMQYKGDALSLGDDLKYGSRTRLFGRAKIEMPLVVPNVYIMATPMKFNGAGNRTANFQFNNQNFAANSPFSSDLNIDQYDVALYYGVPFVKTASAGKFNAEAGLNLKVIDFNAKIDQSATNLHETRGLTLPVPMIYLGAQAKPIDKLSIEAEIRGVSFGSSHFYDVTGRVKCRVINAVLVKGFIGAGYRYEDIKIDADDIRAAFKFSGPFAEVGVEF